MFQKVSEILISYGKPILRIFLLVSPYAKAFQDFVLNFNQGYQLFQRLNIELDDETFRVNVVFCIIFSITVFIATLASSKRLLSRLPCAKYIINSLPRADRAVGRNTSSYNYLVVVPAALFKAYNKATCFSLEIIRLLKNFNFIHSGVDEFIIFGSVSLIMFGPMLMSELAVLLQSSFCKCIQNKCILRILSAASAIGSSFLYETSMYGFPDRIKWKPDDNTLKYILGIPIGFSSLLCISQFTFTYKEQDKNRSRLNKKWCNFYRILAGINGLYKTVVSATSISALFDTLSILVFRENLSSGGLVGICFISGIFSLAAQWASLIPKSVPDESVPSGSGNETGTNIAVSNVAQPNESSNLSSDIGSLEAPLVVHPAPDYSRTRKCYLSFCVFTCCNKDPDMSGESPGNSPRDSSSNAPLIIVVQSN